MISVIVPVHNGEKTLRKCVDAILHSTISDIEIILVEMVLQTALLRSVKNIPIVIKTSK